MTHGVMLPWELPDWEIKKGRFAGLRNWQKGTVEQYERVEYAKDFAGARAMFDALPKEMKCRSKSIYVEPRLTVGRHSLRYFAGGWINQKGLQGSLRSDIREFSRASQRRLKDCIESYDFDPTFFVTLTYPPAVAPDDMETAFFQLRDFCRSADRLHCGGKKPLWIWKKEFQQNGNVHFHLVTNLQMPISDGEPFIKFPKFYNKKRKKRLLAELSLVRGKLVTKGAISRLQDIWARVINDDKDHRNSLDISAVLSDDAVGAYLGKYLSKKDGSTVSAPEHIKRCGRWWGVFNRAHYVRFAPRVFDLSDGLAFYNASKPISHRSTFHVAVFEFLHDFLDSDKFCKIWRGVWKSRGYLKNEWFIPKDKLKKMWLEQKLLDNFVYFDIFVDRVFFDSSADKMRDYLVQHRCDSGNEESALAVGMGIGRQKID